MAEERQITQEQANEFMAKAVTNLELSNWLERVTEGDDRPGMKLSVERLAESDSMLLDKDNEIERQRRIISALSIETGQEKLQEILDQL